MLALESSAKTASAALTENGQLLGQYFQAAGLTHSRTLLPMAEALMKNCERELRELDAIAVAQGPGSFTGVRIGVAAAKGLAWGLEKPVIGVSTLEAMAFGGPTMEGCELCCVMDARREQVYNARFVVRDGRPVRRTEDRAISVAELEEELAAEKKDHILLGDGAQLCYNAFDRERVRVVLAPEPLRLQNARGVALAAQGRPGVTAGELLPVYLRLSQAERERQARLAKG